MISANKKNFGWEIALGKENRSANKHYLAFGGIQLELIVGKPRIDFGNIFGNLNETGLRIKIRCTGKESDIIGKLMILNGVLLYDLANGRSIKERIWVQ